MEAMDYGIVSCIPIAVLIIGILITKRMVEMLILSALVGVALVYKANFLGGLVEQLYGAVMSPSYDFILFVLIGFGILIKEFEQSGAFLGFARLLKKIVKGRKSAMVATWLMGIIMFVDDYLNVLACSTSMKELTDEYNIPREHLAYGVSAIGASICVLIPFTSWGAYGIATTSEMGLGFSDYVHAIPFMFFPIIAIVLCLLVAVGIVPKVGQLKKAYERVDAGGPLLVKEDNSSSLIDLSGNPEEEIKEGSIWFFVIPIIVLVVVMMLCNSDIVIGVIAGVVAQAVLYIFSKRMTLTQFMDNLMAGVTSMAGLGFAVLFVYMLTLSNDAMGFGPYIIGALTKVIPPFLLPLLCFLIPAAIMFAASSFWALIMISMPIFIPMAVEMGINPSIVVAGVMSAGAFGSKLCFYSDDLFMTAGGTGLSNLTIVKNIAPYTLFSAGLACVLYLIVGIVVV